MTKYIKCAFGTHYLALSCKAPDLSTIFANGNTEQTLPIPKPSKTPPHPSHKGREWLLLTKWPHRQYINPSHQCKSVASVPSVFHWTQRPASRNNALRLTKQRPSPHKKTKTQRMNRLYHVHRQNANRGHWQFGVTSRNPHTGESIPGCVRHRESGV